MPEGEQYPAFEPGRDNSLVDESGNPNYAAIRASRDFVAVRRRLTRFVFPMTALFLCWYMTYVLLAAYAPGLMGHRVTGSVTVGLLLGLSQFVLTIVIMLLYVRFTRRRIDPEINKLRERVGAGRS
jgi:uncharacterized membrane protein (DUF485 family)